MLPNGKIIFYNSHMYSYLNNTIYNLTSQPAQFTTLSTLSNSTSNSEGHLSTPKPLSEYGVLAVDIEISFYANIGSYRRLYVWFVQDSNSSQQITLLDVDNTVGGTFHFYIVLYNLYQNTSRIAANNAISVATLYNYYTTDDGQTQTFGTFSYPSPATQVRIQWQPITSITAKLFTLI